MIRLEDVHAIEQLLRTYARLNDKARWHEVAELFNEDARFVRPSDPTRPLLGRAEILQSLLGRPKGARRQHLVANPEVELLDEHNAHATCHSILLVYGEGGGGTVIVGGFEDHLTRTASGWKFQSRIGFSTFDPVPFDPPKTVSHHGIEMPENSSSAATPGHFVP